MKISVTGRMKNNKIQIGYRMFVLSLLKKIISNYSQEYFNELFMYKGKKTKKIKPFTFSVFFRDYKVKTDFIEVNGDVKIIISSPDKKLMMILVSGFMNMKSYGEFIDITAKVEREKDVKDNVEIFKTLAPIYIKNSNNESLAIEDENYSKEFNYFADIILRNYRGYGLKKQLEFVPIKMKKVVVKEEIKSFSEETNKRYIYFNGYSGVFKLAGDIEDLNLLKALGVGARRSSGFGAIDIY